MALKIAGERYSSMGFDFRKAFAYQMVPSGGPPRRVDFETDHSDWIMAPNQDEVDGAPLGLAQAFSVRAIQGSAKPESLGGQIEAFRLPAKAKMSFEFTGQGNHGHFEYKLQPVKKHVPPIRFRISVLPPRSLPYAAFVIMSDATILADIDTVQMGRQFKIAEIVYKTQCNVDLVRAVRPRDTPRIGDPPRDMNIIPIRTDLSLGNPVNLNETWKFLREDLNRGLTPEEQKLLKVVICWNVLSGEERKANKWVDDAVGLAKVGENICFCETELTGPLGQSPEWTTIAHEIGHSLGLKHTLGAENHRNIMVDGNMGAGFSDKFLWFQIEKLNGAMAHKLDKNWFF